LASESNAKLLPISFEIPGHFITPSAAYLKISKGSERSFLLESALGGEHIGRYSWMGANPIHVIESGGPSPVVGDPLVALETLLSQHKTVEGLTDLPFTGFRLRCTR
jgi:anthranilate synthase component I